MIKLISLHPRLVAVMDIVINILLVFGITRMPSWAWLWTMFLGRQIIWLVFIRFMYYPLENIRWRHFLSLFIFSSGLFLFLVFTDRQSFGQILYSDGFIEALTKSTWFLLAGVYLAVVFLSFWFLPIDRVSLAVFLKPHLRWRFIMTAMGMAGIFTGCVSFIVFRVAYQINDWTWLVLTALIATGIAGWWWWEYNLKYNLVFLYSLLAFLAIIFELVWLVARLPLGNLVSGFLLVWLWYLLWILLRFNLSAQGIVWRKQAKFLILNLFIFIIFLIFVARWR